MLFVLFWNISNFYIVYIFWNLFFILKWFEDYKNFIMEKVEYIGGLVFSIWVNGSVKN